MLERELALIMVRVAFACLLAVLLFSVTAHASERALQSLTTVRSVAEEFVRCAVQNESRDSKLWVTAADPDTRLRLTDCGTELIAFTLNGAPIGARNTIGVRCANKTRADWTIYLTVSVEAEKPVLVLRHSLARGAHVGAEDVEVQVRRVPGSGRAHPSEIAALRDQHLKRGVAAGTVLTADLFVRDLLVKRGQEVSLVFDTAGISVRAPGIALSEGGLADRIRVQNRTSLKVVEGSVESGNLVRVGL